MHDVVKLDSQAILAKLDRLENWELQEGCLHARFEFADFKSAFAFMQSVAQIAERINHHPDWSNTYNIVTIDLCTNDVMGLSRLDFELADAISRIIATQ